MNWWVFVGVVAVAYFVPGPDMAVILRSATHGSRPGLLGGRLVLPPLRRTPRSTTAQPEQVSARSAFGQGLVTNLLNPKAALFFAAVLPQFLADGPLPAWVQVVVLGFLDIALGFLAWGVVIAVGVRLAALLRSRRARNWWDRATGAALGGVGGGLLVTR